MSAGPFTWNGRYERAQVEAYFEAYMVVYRELRDAGQYPYNDCFKGRIPGIAGAHEDTAIYLLQGLRKLREEAERLEKLESELRQLTSLAATTRFKRVVLYWPEHYVGGTGRFLELESARVLPGIDGTPQAVLPKGKRTHGHRVDGARVYAA